MFKEIKTLYLEERGCAARFPYDLYNHRYAVVERVPVVMNRQLHNMFFEFTQYEAYKTRTENKRTGQPLKHPVRELVNPFALAVHCEYEITEYMYDGTPYTACYGCHEIERKAFDAAADFCKKSILNAVNVYSIYFYSKVVIIEQEAKRIIIDKGGNRELDILAADPICKADPDEWNDEHKIVYVYARRNHKLAERCELDLVTGLIVG